MKKNLDISKEQLELINKLKTRYLYDIFECIPFNDERLTVHNTISCLSLYLKIEDEEDLRNNFKYEFNNISKIINKNKRKLNSIKSKTYKYIKKKYKLFKKNKLDTSSEEYKYFTKFKKILNNENIKNIDENILFLVSNKFTQDKLKYEYETIIKNYIYNNIDENLLIQSSNQPKVKAYLYTGGPASGKTKFTTEFIKSNYVEYFNAVKINPDYYKPLLLSESELEGENKKYHSSSTHSESSLINGNIFKRWQELCQNDDYNTFLIDACTADDWYLIPIEKTGLNIKNQIMTLNTLTALTRAYYRGKKEGRFVPTKSLLERHKWQLNSFINNVKKHTKIDIEIFSNDVAKNNIPIKSITKEPNSNTIGIYDLKSAVEFWNKQYINIEAINEEELQTHNDDYKTVIMGFAKETEKEIHIYGKDGKTIIAKSNGNNIEILNKKEFDLIIKNAGYEKDTNIIEQTNVKPIIINQNINTQNQEQCGKDMSDELFGPHVNEINPSAINKSNHNLELSRMNIRLLKNLKITQLLNSLKQSKLIKEN